MTGNIIDLMTPILLAALGGLFTELAGVLNIALEGLILTGAFTAIVVTGFTGSLFLGILTAAFVSIFLAFIFSLASLKLKANIFIAGLATNLFAAGMITFFSKWLFNTKGVIKFDTFPDFSIINIPIIREIPIIGEIISGHNGLVYIGFLLSGLTAWILYKTPFGLRLRVTGLNSETLRSRGKNPLFYKYAAILISGFMCGLAGAFISLKIGAYVPNISAGKGWIALVAIYLGFKKPAGILIACFLFAGAETLSNIAQGIFNIPGTLILSFPYIITVSGLIIFSIIQHKAQNR